MNGVGPLLGQRLRRDGVQLAIWIGGTVALAAAGHPAVQNSYGDETERTALLATVMANPVILLFRGLPSGADEWQMVVFLMLPWLLILAALMSTFLAVRHTRGDEEEGRLELLSATPAGRFAPTAATVIHGTLANLVLGAAVAAVFLAGGAPGGGAALVGLSCALVGVCLLGVGLVAAQLLPTSRGANSLAIWVLVGTFVLAGIGNALGTPSDDLTRMTSAWPAWLSPFGWAENVRAFDADAGGPLALLGALVVVLVAGAFALQSRRDLGSAFVPERVGRADARPALASHLALAARLATPSVVGWIVAGLLVGLLATSLGGVAAQIGGQNPAVADILAKISGATGDAQRGVVVVFFTLVGILAACAGVQTVVRARQDETRGTAEPVLATALTRVHWIGDHLALGLLAATVTVAGAVVGAVLGASSGSGTPVGEILIAGVGQLLPAWLFAGVTALVFVLAPRWTIPAAWTLVMLAAVIGLFGPVFGFSQAVIDASPFTAAPKPVSDGVDAGGAVWMAVALVLAIGAALMLMRRRELASGG